MSMRSKSSWNLEVLVFKERVKWKYLEKNLLEQGRKPTTNSTHIWRGRQDSNQDHIGGRLLLSPLHYTLAPHPCYHLKSSPGHGGTFEQKIFPGSKDFFIFKKLMEASLENSKVMNVLVYSCGLGDPTHLRPKSSICHPMSAIGVNLFTTALMTGFAHQKKIMQIRLRVDWINPWLMINWNRRSQFAPSYDWGVT